MAKRSRPSKGKGVGLMTAAVTQTERLLTQLVKRSVDFVVIGGIAAVLHGSPYPTSDVDICARDHSDNLERLADALLFLEAREWDYRKDVSVARKWSVETLSADNMWILETKYGRLDILMQPAGTRGYGDLSKRRKIVRLERIDVPIADIHDLIRMKEAAGREVDLLHIPVLRKLAERSS